MVEGQTPELFNGKKPSKSREFGLATILTSQLNLLFLMPQSMKVLARCGIQPERKPYDFSHVPTLIRADKVLLTIRPLLLLGLRDGDRGSN